MKGDREAVLIVGAGHLQVPMIIEAKHLGLHTLATDGSVYAPGAQIADDFFCYDTYDAKSHRILVKILEGKFNIRGVATCGADVAPTVAHAAEAAGTFGLPHTVAERSHDKLAVRQRLDEALLDMYQPSYTYGLGDGTGPDLDDVDAFIKRYLPVVVKPANQCASRGVSICTTEQEVVDAIKKAHQYSSRVLIEERLVGTEHSAEIIFDQNGETIFFNIVDRKFDYQHGIPMEVGHVNPSNLPTHEWARIRKMVQRAAEALAITWGPFKCDIVMSEGGPKILECTARLSGGFDCQYTTPYATARNPIRAVLQLACGMPVDRHVLKWPEEYGCQHRYAACAAIFLREGIVQKPMPEFAYTKHDNPVILTFSATQPPVFTEHEATDIEHVFIFAKPGDKVGSYQHCAERSGFVIATDWEYEKAWKKAVKTAQLLSDHIHIGEER